MTIAVADTKSPVERFCHAALTSEDVDDLLRATIAAFVEAASMQIGVIRVSEPGGWRSRATVGLEEEVRAGFMSPVGTSAPPGTPFLLRLPLDEPRVSDFMRRAGVETVYWLNLPQPTSTLAACLGSRNAGDLPAERGACLETLATLAARAISRLQTIGTLEETLRGRDQVLADIAHDLKNSINAVALSTSVLEHRIEPVSPHRTTIERIARNTRRAARVVESLLSCSVIDAGKLVLTQDVLEPAELVLAATEAQQDAGMRAGVAIASDVTQGLAQMRGDRERILEVFDNLIGNALKFTKANGTITVGAAPRDDHVLFWVKDTGSGIASEELPRVFERYWRAKSGDRMGSGLGLSICKGIVEAHGGRIWAESGADLGTTMLFTLPVLASRVEPDAVPRRLGV